MSNRVSQASGPKLRPKPQTPDTPIRIKELVDLHAEAIKERKIPPLVLLAAFNLDFLCIHPFRDGNGRVSRLLLLLQCYHLGFEVGRYISLERLIEQNKERYYETLEQSSQGWHEGKHDPWPYINYTLFIIRSAYGNSSSVSANFRVPRARKRVSFFRLSTGPSVLSAWPNFRTSARTSVWI